MSLITSVVDGALLLGMIGVSLYGAAVLPATARWPLHLGPGGYGNWVSRNIGLLMGPIIATAICVILIITVRTQQSGDGTGLTGGLTAVLAVMLVNQIGALRAALSQAGRN